MPFSAELRALFEHGLDGILLTIPDGEVLAANPAACRMLGWSEDEIRQLGRHGLLDDADSRVAAALAERRRTGRFFGELSILRRDGTRFPVEVSSAIYTTPAGEPRTWVIFRDASQRHKAEADLRAALDNMSAIIESAPVAIQGITTTGEVTVWNAAAERLFGWTAAEVIGQPNKLVRDEDMAEHLGLRERVLAGESLTGVDLRRHHKDGSPLEVSLSTAQVRGADGSVRGVLALFEDASRRRAAEELRRRTDQIEALRRLAVGLRHVMNNALAALQLELELIDEEGDPAARQRSVQVALGHVSQLAATLRRLERVEDLQAVPYLGDTMMLDVSSSREEP